ncbi:MAG: hypothetical protein Q8J84_08820 [Flavobacteriaceae bacterium]|nr:hypothetical protein [Flavobacteriaceae bacterium]
MNPMQITKFGLTFPQNFPLNEKTCEILAKQLFLNSNISTVKTKKLLNKSKQWEVLKFIDINKDLFDLTICIPELLNLTKQEEVDLLLAEGLAEAESEFLDKDDLILLKYRPKIIAWLQNFAFPKLSEITAIADELSILDREKIVKYFRNLLYDEKLPKEKIVDYLLKYNKILSSKKIDRLLDLYNKKSQLKYNHHENIL